MKSYIRQKGFSLIELLVVIAIIGLLVSILLPALGQARLAGQLTVSLANMRSQGQMMLMYANDHKDSFVNPFGRPVSGAFSSPGIEWYSVKVSRDPGSYEPVRFDDPQRTTEAFAMHWSSTMHQYMGSNDTESANKSQFSPLDHTVLARSKEWYDQVMNNKAPGSFTSILWDVSYWTSPTLWIKPSRYSGITFKAINTSVGANGSELMHRNRTSDVIHSNGKVMVFERFDFSKKSRLAGPANNPGAARQAQYPSFNNPEATARYITCDGSSGSVKIQSLLTAANDTKTRAIYAPSGGWALSTTHLKEFRMENDGIQNGGDNGGPYTAFFWSTRNGVKGRDIPN